MTFAATMAGYTTGLIGWWRLNEPSGTSIADSSGAGHTMTAAAGVTVAQPGLLGDGTGDTACTFNGTAQCSIAHATWMNTSAVTVFCRFNGTVAAQSTLVCIDDSGSSPGFSWRLQRGVSSLQGLHRSGTTVSSPTGSVEQNATYSAGYVHTGTVSRIYLNGNNRGEQPAVALVIGTAALRIGRLSATEGFTGTIDEVCVWNIALTDADMMTLHLAASYASLFGPRTPLYNPSRNRATLRASSF